MRCTNCGMELNEQNVTLSRSGGNSFAIACGVIALLIGLGRCIEALLFYFDEMFSIWKFIFESEHDMAKWGFIAQQIFYYFINIILLFCSSYAFYKRNKIGVILGITGLVLSFVVSNSLFTLKVIFISLDTIF